jgi:hypothetical protein
LEDRATLLENINHCIATPRLSRDSSCVTYNRINTRTTIIDCTLTGSNQTLSLLLYTFYLSDTKAAISKCKP